MSESVNYEKFSVLKYLKETRKGLGQEELDIKLLIAQVGSQDPSLVEKSKRLLMEKWDIAPEKDAENAPSIDIMKQFESFSEEERNLIFSQLVGIQLTEGCNGNCPFCLFGKKKGVEAKYSFESISAFIKKYGEQFSKIPAFYWDSDPFDYRDNGRSFLDVYKLWRDVKPNEYYFISTAIPRGGEQDFINFIRYAAESWRSKKLTASYLKVRISLAKHNIQRVEAVFEKLVGGLSADGFSKEEINGFLKEIIFIKERFKSEKLGQLIVSHEDVRDILTPACSDGILIIPKSVKAVMITAPTVYEPSGEKDVNVMPGRVNLQTPLNLSIGDYKYFNNDLRSPLSRAKTGHTILRRVLTTEAEEYSLENPVEDIVLKLGREAASYGRFIEELRNLPYFIENFSGVSKRDLRNSLDISARTFRERQEYNSSLIERAEALITGGNLSSAEIDKIKFYILLSKTYMAEMDFIADQIENKQSVAGLAVIASVFRRIGREQASKLPEIIKKELSGNKILWKKTWKKNSRIIN